MTEFPGATGLVLNEPLLWEKGRTGRCGFSLPRPDVERCPAPAALTGPGPDFPDLSEVDVVRHYTRLSTWNFSVDTGMYPLGSCTMKYNPKINEKLAALPGFARAHPLLPAEACQGELRRVPRVLVRKRYHPANTHGGWADLPPDQAVATTVGLIGSMRKRAMQGLSHASGEAGLIETAALLRLLGCGGTLLVARHAPAPALLYGHLGTDGLIGLLAGARTIRDHPEAQPLRKVLAEAACRARLAALAATMPGSVWSRCLNELMSLAGDAGGLRTDRP